MAAGFRSPLAPWAGGASAPLPPALVGFRGLLAPWLGGASAVTTGGETQEPHGGGVARRLRLREKDKRQLPASLTERLTQARRRLEDESGEIETRPAAPFIERTATETSTGPRNPPTAPPIKPATTIQTLRQAEPSAVQTIAAELAARDALATEAADQATTAAAARARMNRNRAAILLALLMAND